MESNSAPLASQPALDISRPVISCLLTPLPRWRTLLKHTSPSNPTLGSCSINFRLDTCDGTAGTALSLCDVTGLKESGQLVVRSGRVTDCSSSGPDDHGDD